jgi:hypothetical protein
VSADEDPWAWPEFFAPVLTDADYALGRVTGRTYFSKSFPLQFGHGDEQGQPSRYVYRILADGQEPDPPCPPHCGCEEYPLYTSPKERIQLQAHVVADAGRVRRIRFQRVRNLKSGATIEDLVTLDEEAAQNLVQCVMALRSADPALAQGFRVDDELLEAVLQDPAAISAVFARGGTDLLRSIIEGDLDAEDVIALAARRNAVGIFSRMLEDDAYFDGLAAGAGGEEKAWQTFLEDNPWVLGVGLGSQLLTPWTDKRLEQVVAGYTVAKSGKRADALLRTAGLVRAMAFAEIKHHRSPLLGVEYRPGCWSVSAGVSGAIIQTQQTVFQAVKDLSDKLVTLDDEGADTDDVTHLIRPRSFLIVGSLRQLRSRNGGGGVIEPKYRSFELFRRNLYEPEILTFDELYARAEWHVSKLESESEYARRTKRGDRGPACGHGQ